MKVNKLREEMAQTFIAALKEDRIPWEKQWQSIERPRNGVSDYSYKGINNLWLSYIAEEKGYQDPRWCTFKQAQSQGWKVRKGEKGSKVEFWSLYDTKDKRKVTQEEVKKIREQLTNAEFQERIKPISSVYTVFNAEQIDGIPKLEEVKISFSAEELISQRDVLLKNMHVDFHEGGDRAFYRPSDDSITLPFVESFQDAYAYMATFLHEAGHATGHESRLDRQVRNTFGSPAYAKEELRAEIASAFTGQALGIDGMSKEHLDNHKAYIQSWIKTLEDNPGELYAAIRDAEKISDYLIEKGEFDLASRMQEQLVSSNQLDAAEFVSEHQEKLNTFDGSQSTHIINLFGGPGSGKTTCAMSICSELKKLGYSAEYVQEYAKELVYEKNFDLLDGSEMHQFGILQEQMNRVDRLLGGEVDFIVCDAPIVLNGIYNQELTAEYSEMLQNLFHQYQNLSFFIERDVTSYQQEGRMQTFQESVEKDAEIRKMLDSYGISWDSCTHEMLDQIVHKAVEQYQQSGQEVDQSPQSALAPEDIEIQEILKVSKQLAGRLVEDGMDVYVTPEDLTGRENIGRVANLKTVSALEQDSASLYVSKTAFDQRKPFFPTVQCRLSESPAFEEGKFYTVSEFDYMMELEDRLFLEKKLDLLQKYKDFDGVAKAIVEDGLPGNSLGYLGYHKVAFMIETENKRIVERQDIGDGDGSLLEFLEKCGYQKEVIDGLQEEMNVHAEFLSYQEKLNDVWNNLDHPSGIEEQTMHLHEQNNTFHMQRRQIMQGRGAGNGIKGVVPVGR